MSWQALLDLPTNALFVQARQGSRQSLLRAGRGVAGAGERAGARAGVRAGVAMLLVTLAYLPLVN